MSAEQLAPVASSINDFGFALFATMDPSQNALFSPYDVSRALSLLELASAGETQAEIDRALRFADAPRVIAALPALAQTLERSARRPGFALSSAARVWPSNTMTVLDSYRDSVAQNLGAPLVPLDYVSDPEAQRRTINGWVSRQTQGRIPELLGGGSVDQATRFVLTTALYFLGRWRATFDSTLTRDGDFFVSAGRAKSVPMMSGPLSARYVQDGDVRMIELDYEGEELSMNVMIPAPGRALSAVSAQLNAANFARWVSAAREQSVIVELPRFTLRKQVLLRSSLEAVGVRSVFSSSANLQRLTTSERPMIGSVIHEVFVAVNETGTEAAAATAVAGYGSGGGTPVFSVNQPFVFAIRHKPTGTILFLGHVVDPAPDVEPHDASGAPFSAGARDSMIPAYGPGLQGRSLPGPIVRASAPTVQGALAPEAIRRIVLRNLGAVTHCHERGLATNPSASGRVEVSFTINAEGSVRGASTNDAYPVPEVRACVQRVFERLQFPRPERGEVTVVYPVMLLTTD
ncbi:MAG: serpin family protein [Polyangiales bacterium]